MKSPKFPTKIDSEAGNRAVRVVGDEPGYALGLPVVEADFSHAVGEQKIPGSSRHAVRLPKSCGSKNE